MNLLCTSWSWSIRFLLSRKCCLLVVRIQRHVDMNWFPCFLWHVWRGFKAKVTSRCFPVSLERCSSLGFINFVKWDWWSSLPYHSQCIYCFYWGSVQILWLRKRDLAMREYTSEPLPSRSFCCGSILRSRVKHLCSMWFFCGNLGPFHPSYPAAPLTFNILVRRTSF